MGSLSQMTPQQQLVIQQVNRPTYCSVLRIHDILVWIRIRGSLPLTNGSTDPDPAIVVIDLKRPTKN